MYMRVYVCECVGEGGGGGRGVSVGHMLTVLPLDVNCLTFKKYILTRRRCHSPTFCSRVQHARDLLRVTLEVIKSGRAM
jgi:hypothetical protein